jgi:hypothetical protein
MAAKHGPSPKRYMIAVAFYNPAGTLEGKKQAFRSSEIRGE